MEETVGGPSARPALGDGIPARQVLSGLLGGLLARLGVAVVGEKLDHSVGEGLAFGLSTGRGPVRNLDRDDRPQHRVDRHGSPLGRQESEGVVDEGVAAGTPEAVPAALAGGPVRRRRHTEQVWDELDGETDTIRH